MLERESLKGLPGVRVVVERFRSSAESAGFDRQIFQTDVELRLRMAGIAASEDSDWPVLYLNVNALDRKENERGGYSIGLELIQPVLLCSQLRSDLTKTLEDAMKIATIAATTWTSGSLGFGSIVSVRDAVKDAVDRFINDWLAVNPIDGKR